MARFQDAFRQPLHADDCSRADGPCACSATALDGKREHTAFVPERTVRGLSERLTQRSQMALRLGWTADAPTLKLVGTDRRLAVERVFEIGASIQEIDRYITNQTQVLTMTETEGYDILDGVATKILDINA
jgi:hypothetical protein